MDLEVRLPEMESPLRIVERRVYRYSALYPAKCHDHLYRMVMFVEDVPSGQEKVVVEGLTGPDKGRRQSCSPLYFANHFRPAVEEVQGSSGLSTCTMPVGELVATSALSSGY